MDSQKLFIPVILGTNREGRQSEKAARFIMAGIAERGDIETTLFDVKNFNLPPDDYGESIKERFPEYRDAIVRADGLILVSPEYNHGYSGRLKSVLDLLLAEYKHKAAGIVGVSSGMWGGTRGIESIIHVTRELGLVTIGKDLNVPLAKDAFNDDGTARNEKLIESRMRFLAELVWMARTLKYGRENMPVG